MSRLTPLLFPPLHRIRRPVLVQRNADGDSFESRSLWETPPAERPLVMMAPDRRISPEQPPREPSDPTVRLVMLLAMVAVVVGGICLFAWMMGGGR